MERSRGSLLILLGMLGWVLWQTGQAASLSSGACCDCSGKKGGSARSVSYARSGIELPSYSDRAWQGMLNDLRREYHPSVVDRPAKSSLSLATPRVVGGRKANPDANNEYAFGEWPKSAEKLAQSVVDLWTKAGAIPLIQAGTELPEAISQRDIWDCATFWRVRGESYLEVLRSEARAEVAVKSVEATKRAWRIPVQMAASTAKMGGFALQNFAHWGVQSGELAWIQWLQMAQSARDELVRSTKPNWFSREMAWRGKSAETTGSWVLLTYNLGRHAINSDVIWSTAARQIEREIEALREAYRPVFEPVRTVNRLLSSEAFLRVLQIWNEVLTARARVIEETR